MPLLLTPDELRARLLYRDAMMLVLDKPAGIPVHAGPKGGPHLEQYLEHLAFGLPNPPALAHRLDKDTSGCLALGRHRKATALLGGLFAAGAVKKAYWAVLAGGPPTPEGSIDAPLGRKAADKRSWWMKVDPVGLPAVTHWRVLAQRAGLSFVELVPETGRTHQLRVHMAHLDCPIVGDAVYGGGRATGIDRRLHLHARMITIPLYPRKPPIIVEAPVPEHMKTLIGMASSSDMR